MKKLVMNKVTLYLSYESMKLFNSDHYTDESFFEIFKETDLFLQDFNDEFLLGSWKVENHTTQSLNAHDVCRIVSILEQNAEIPKDILEYIYDKNLKLFIDTNHKKISFINI